MKTAVFIIGITLIQHSGVLGLSLLATVLVLMGTAVAQLDAAERRETLWPHYLQSLDHSFFYGTHFRGSGIVVMKFATEVNFCYSI